MTTTVLDFTGTNGTLPAGWSDASTGSGDFSIQGNKMRSSAGGGSLAAAALSFTSWTTEVEQWYQYDLTIGNTSTTHNFVPIISNTNVGLLVSFNSIDDLIRIESLAAAVIASAPLSAAVSNGQVWRIKIHVIYHATTGLVGVKVWRPADEDEPGSPQVLAVGNTIPTGTPLLTSRYFTSFAPSGGPFTHDIDDLRLSDEEELDPVTGFPSVASVVESSVNTADTSHVVTLPGSIGTDDGVLILMDIGSTSATMSPPTDWTEILDENVANGLKVYWWTGSGVPGGNPTFTSSASTRSANLAWRIPGADKGTNPQIGTTATGTSTTPDPPSVTPTGDISKKYLSIAFFGAAGEEDDDDTWANTPPSIYIPSPPYQKACGVAGTNLGGKIAAAYRQLETGSAINPGTLSQDISTAWRAQHVLIHPTPVSTAPVFKRWNGSAWVESTIKHGASWDVVTLGSL